MKSKLLLLLLLCHSAVFGQNTLAGKLTVQQTVQLTGDISPTAITANQNDYAPTGYATAAIMYLSSDATRTITGLAGGAEGRQVQLFYSGTGVLKLANQSASSTAANRFALTADCIIPTGQSVLLTYDSTASRWKIAGGYHTIHEPMNVKWFGAVGDGTTDDSTPVAAAVALLTASRVTDPTGADPISSVTLFFPPGVFKIVTSESLLPSTFNSKTRGYRILGSGIGQSVVWFKPTTGSRVLLANSNAFLASEVRDITFTSDSASNTFMTSLSDPGSGGANQRWSFDRVSWTGTWGKGFNLTGTNNNSEWKFSDCSVSGEMGSFLYIGASSTSDQFLNFWFDHMTFWPTSTSVTNNFCDISAGGSVKITDSDFSGLQKVELFKLNGASHAGGVCSFIVSGTRFELKSTNCKVITSQWPQGNVVFRDCDFSSQASLVSSAFTAFEFDYINFQGPAILFDSCDLMGQIVFAHSTDDFRSKKSVVFRNCNFGQFVDIFDSFVFTASTNQGGHPAVTFENCKGGGTTLSFSTAWAASTAYVVGNQRVKGLSLYEVTVAGTSAGSGGPTGKGSAITDGTVTWKYVRNDNRDYITDTTYNWTSTHAPNGKQRTASFKNATSQFPSAGGSIEIILPPNVVVTRVQIFSDSGNVSSGAAAAYTVQTDETSPTVLLTINQTPASGGFSGVWEGFFPVGTSMATRCLKLLAGASVDQFNAGAYCVVTYID